jgi:formamidopyrimidine-DNA glycosylase
VSSNFLPLIDHSSMPELPEVETVRRGLEHRVLGRTISAVRVLTPWVIRSDPKSFPREMEGCRVKGLRRQGKTLALELERGDSAPSRYLIVRLGMTGQLTLTSSQSPLLPHTHVRLLLDDDGEELRYRDPRRFGMLRCSAPAEAEKIFRSLGPDALEIGKEEFEQAVRGRRGAIKGWLLNQKVLAGLGNIYADEALFEARIHPQTPAGKIPQNARILLHKAIRKVLQRAVNLQGTSFRDYIDIEGRPGNFEPRLRVYGREGKPCPRCSMLIQRVVVCGRSSHFCPRCQPRPRRIAPPGKPRKKQG